METRDLLIGGGIGALIAWLLFRMRMRMRATFLSKVETLLEQGAITKADRDTVIEYINTGTSIGEADTWIMSRVKGTVSDSAGAGSRISVPGTSDTGAWDPLAPPGITGPECYTDFECQQKYGPNWKCHNGGCIETTSIPPVPPSDEPEQQPVDLFPPQNDLSSLSSRLYTGEQTTTLTATQSTALSGGRNLTGRLNGSRVSAID